MSMKPTIERKTTSYKNLDVVRGRSNSGDKGLSIPSIEKLKGKERPMSVIQTSSSGGNASETSLGALSGRSKTGKDGSEEFHSHLVYLIKDFSDTIVAKKGGTIVITQHAVSFSLTDGVSQEIPHYMLLSTNIRSLPQGEMFIDVLCKDLRHHALQFDTIDELRFVHSRLVALKKQSHSGSNRPGGDTAPTSSTTSPTSTNNTSATTTNMTASITATNANNAANQSPNTSEATSTAQGATTSNPMMSTLLNPLTGTYTPSNPTGGPIESRPPSAVVSQLIQSYKPFDEVVRQGYSTSLKWWKPLGTSVILQALEGEDIKNLAEFHEEKKFPEYCWGNWDARSKLYGSVLLRCRRPTCFVSGNTKPWHELSGAVGLQAQLSGRKLFFALKNLMEKIPTPNASPSPLKHGRRIILFDTGLHHDAQTEFFRPFCKIFYLNFNETSVNQTFEDLFDRCTSHVADHTTLLKSIEIVNWFKLISCCLTQAKIIVEEISLGNWVLLQNGGSLIGNTDSVLACLVQLMIDPYLRTIPGLLNLIVKDFFIFSGKIPSTREKVWAIFFFFVSCMFELFVQQPTAFEWTEDFFVFLMDVIYRVEFLPGIYIDNFVSEIESKQGQFLSDCYVPVKYLSCKDMKDTVSLWTSYILRHCRNVVLWNQRINEKLALFQVEYKNDPTKELRINPRFYLPSLPAFPELTTLHITNGHLALPPRALGTHFNSLQKLFLDGNVLATAPHFAHMTNLTYLSLSRNRLLSMERLSAQQSLTTLILDDNKLKTLAPLASIPSLTHLSIRKNRLKHVHAGIAKLTRLSFLDLGENLLTAFPPDVLGFLNGLRTLKLDQNAFSVFPDDFSNLTCLEDLDMSHCNLWFIPLSIFQCPEVKKLDFGYNKLCDLPLDFKHLSNLTSLNLKQNLLTILPHTLPLCYKLKYLCLSGNKMKEIPIWFYRFRILESLEFDNNRIEKLATSLSNMYSLRHLNLSNNNLTALPVTFGCLKDTLQHLQFSGNNIKNLPSDIPHDTKSVLTYLNNSLKDAFDINRLKIFICGQEKTGRSSLAKQLKYYWSQSSGQPEEEMDWRPVVQDGIYIYNLNRWISPSSFKEPKDSKSVSSPMATNRSKGDKAAQATSDYGLHLPAAMGGGSSKDSERSNLVEFKIWDFQGTEAFYTAHQFFMAGDALYIICFSLVDRNIDASMDFWIHSLKSRASLSKVLIVGTNKDKMSADKLPAIHQEFTQRYSRELSFNNNLMGIVFVNNLNGDGIAELVRHIELAGSQKPPNKVPASYLLLEKVLQEYAGDLECPVVGQHELMRIGATCQLSPKDVMKCMNLLHNTGTVLYFDKVEELKDLFILDAQWLFRTMCMLFSPQNTSLGRGTAKMKDLEACWKSFPPLIHPMLLELMKKFSLAFPVDEHYDILVKVRAPPKTVQPSDSKIKNEFQDFILIPALLPKIRPNSLILTNWSPFPPVGVFHYERLFRFSALPSAMFSRILTKLFQTPIKIISLWKGGILTEVDDGAALLFIEHSFHEGTVRKQAKANTVSNAETTDQLLANEMLIQVRGRDVHYLRDLFSAVIALMHATTSDYRLLDWLRLARKPQDSTQQWQTDVVADTTWLQLDDIEKQYFSKPSKSNEMLTVGNRSFAFADLLPDQLLVNYTGPKVDFNDFHLGNVLGVGSFATVMEADLGDGKPFALKVLKIQTDAKRYEVEKAIYNTHREILLQSSLDHPNIVKILGISLQPLSIMFELCPHGNLHDLIHNYSKRLSWRYIIRIATELAGALDYLHSLNPPVIHLDFKSPNVLIRSMDENDEGILCQIADFGEAQIFRYEINRFDISNPIWLAPERVLEKPYALKVDTYAFGIICWEMGSRLDVFSDTNWVVVICDRIIAGERPEFHEFFPMDWEKFVRLCWHQKPKFRPEWKFVMQQLAEFRKADHLWDELYGVPYHNKVIQPLYETELLKTTPFKKKPEPDMQIEIHGSIPPQQLTDLCTFTPRGARSAVNPNNPSTSDDGVSMGGSAMLGVPTSAVTSHPNSPRKKSVGAQISEIIHHPSIFITNTTYSGGGGGGNNPTGTNNTATNPSPQQSNQAIMTNSNYSTLAHSTNNAYNTNPNPTGSNTPPSEPHSPPSQLSSSTGKLGEKKEKEKSFKTKLNFPGRKLSGTRPKKDNNSDRSDANTKDSIKPATGLATSDAITEASTQPAHSYTAQPPSEALSHQPAHQERSVFQREGTGEREVPDLERHSSAAAYDNIKLPLNFGLGNRGADSNNSGAVTAQMSSSNATATSPQSPHDSPHVPRELNNNNASTTTASSTTGYQQQASGGNLPMLSTLSMRDSDNGGLFLTNPGSSSPTVVVNDFSPPPSFSHKAPERPATQSYLHHQPEQSVNQPQQSVQGGGGQPSGMGHLHTHFAQMEHRSQRSLTNPIVVDSEHYETIQGIGIFPDEKRKDYALKPVRGSFAALRRQNTKDLSSQNTFYQDSMTTVSDADSARLARFSAYSNSGNMNVTQQAYTTPSQPSPTLATPSNNTNSAMTNAASSTGVSVSTEQRERPRSQYGHSDSQSVAKEHLGLTQTLVSPTVTNVKKQKIGVTSSTRKEHAIVTFMKAATISEFKELIQFFGQHGKDSDVNCLYRIHMLGSNSMGDIRKESSTIVSTFLFPILKISVNDPAILSVIERKFLSSSTTDLVNLFNDLEVALLNVLHPIWKKFAKERGINIK